MIYVAKVLTFLNPASHFCKFYEGWKRDLLYGKLLILTPYAANIETVMSVSALLFNLSKLGMIGLYQFVVNIFFTFFKKFVTSYQS